MTGTRGRKKISAIVLAALVLALAGPGGLMLGKAKPEEPSNTFYKDGKTVVARNPKGVVEWQTTLKEKVKSVQMIEGILFALCDNTVTRLSPERGDIIWAAGIRGEKRLNLVGGALFIQTSETLFRYNPEDGIRKWRYTSGEKTQAYEILEKRVVVVRTDRRVALLTYSRGREFGARPATSQKFTGAMLLGDVVLLEMDNEYSLYLADTGRQVASGSPRDFKKWAGLSPADALANIAKALRVSSQNRKLEALATLHLLKAESGRPWVVEALNSKDKAVKQAMSDVMSRLADLSKSSSQSVAVTANAVVINLAAMDDSGRIEKDFYTALFGNHPEELPVAESIVVAFIRMLRLGDKKMRAHSIAMLMTLVGLDFDYKADGTMRDRSRCSLEWEKWYEKHRGSFEWDVPNRKIRIR